MVTVNNYAVRERTDGTTFITLEITGGLELIQSSTTGNYYATMRRCSITSTLDETTAQGLIGTKLPGQIVKQETDAYEYLNKRTGETIMLNYTYAYQPDNVSAPVGHTKVADMEMA